MSQKKSTVNDTGVVTESTLLPVGILINGKRYKKVTLRALTVAESYQALNKSKADEFIGLLELAQMTTLDDLGRNPTYDELAGASKLDGDHLNAVRYELEKKELAQANESA